MLQDLPFQPILPWIFGITDVILVAVAGTHIILNKRDVRAAIGWAGLVVLSPFLGALAYYFFGINRIRRKAERKTAGRPGRRFPVPAISTPTPAEIGVRFGEQFATLARSVGRATGQPLVEGNAVRPLIDGDQAYPAMLEAIAAAERSIALTTYIFDNDRAGLRFLSALSAAVRRGVEVRVLIDGVGARYSRPRITGVLRQAGVRSAEFLPSRLPWRNPYMNLRSHRKILIVDGRVGFVGGMNVREGNVLRQHSRTPIRDVHFRVEGPVLTPLFSALAHDWEFTTGEKLEGPLWKCPGERAGPVVCRAISDGPDEDFETIRWTLLAALGCARGSVLIVTPYFLPDATLIAALDLTAMRGVEVDIVLPSKNNLRFVAWAATAQLWQVLRSGCRVWLTPGPFDHSKIMVVDDAWSLVGSANWDPRSLRLNFEVNVECYDAGLAAELRKISEEKMIGARRVTLDEVDGRPLPIKLRDGVARLFSPYL